MADYAPQIEPALLAQLTPDDVRAEAERNAQQEIMSYWVDTLDVFSIFGNEPVHPLVRMYWVDVALYHLYSRVSSGEVPPVRKQRYEAALQWAAHVASGELNLLLPRAQQGEVPQNVPFYVYGTQPKTHYR